MMLARATLVIILAIVEVKCEDLKYGYVHINTVLYSVEWSICGDRFRVVGQKPVLYRGSITDIERMHSLSLRRNSINTIEPGAFGKLPNLKILSINYNKNLQRIEVGVFNNLNLGVLDVANNNLEYIAPHAFDNLTHLKSVDISSNKLKRWDTEWFANTPSLFYFLLGRNLFTEIPANAFRERNTTENFYFINFEYNPINHIDEDAFKNFAFVSVLYISINSTDALEGNFHRATHFHEVHIRMDEIEDLDEKYFAKIMVANVTTLVSRNLREDCKDKIIEWATAHQKAISIHDSWVS